jgi:hypothetical protein
MTNQHPITPPPELVQQWINEEPGIFAEHIAARAAQWGADQELEACCHWLREIDEVADELRLARRPKPPSLKEQALQVFDKLEHLFDGYGHDGATIRRALEQLP